MLSSAMMQRWSQKHVKTFLIPSHCNRHFLTLGTNRWKLAYAGAQSMPFLWHMRPQIHYYKRYSSNLIQFSALRLFLVWNSCSSLCSTELSYCPLLNLFFKQTFMCSPCFKVLCIPLCLTYSVLFGFITFLSLVPPLAIYGLHFSKKCHMNVKIYYFVHRGDLTL